MNEGFTNRLETTLQEIREQGLEKKEWPILTPQSAHIRVLEGDVLNFCANNYLGLANDPRLVEAARKGLEEYGLGMASVRFICGTQDQHKRLENRIAEFLGYGGAILYAACFDANGGVFEPLLSEEDAIISDSLNHASIIDGVRLCKARRFRYAHSDMQDLERCLKEAADARTRMIATDGVFSMDGEVAHLADICELADRHEAVVFVDDCHATGFFGEGGRGTPAHCGVEGRVDILTSTLGKALGGASGGFVASSREVVDLLRQRSRPYLFSNTLAPPLVAASIACIDLLAASDEPRVRLAENTARFRQGMNEAGFDIIPGEHPIVPVMLGDARLAGKMAQAMLKRGIYVIGFSFPVVPRGQARIRVQLSAAHSREDVEAALEAFVAVGRELSVIS